MKHIILIALCIIGIRAEGQTPHFTGRTHRAVNPLASFYNLQKTTSKPLARTSSVRGERLIGQADYILEVVGSALLLTDSVAIVYSGGRGSLKGALSGPFTDFNSLTANQIFGISESLGFPSAKNEAPPIMCDSIYSWSISPIDLTYGYWATLTHKYDAGNNLLDDQYIGASIGTSAWQRDLFTYNSASAVTSITEFIMSDTSSSGFPWDTTAIDIFTYNATGQMVEDSQSTKDPYFLTWGPDTKFTYEYDASGKIISAQAFAWYSSWYLSGQYNWTYYSGTSNLHVYKNESFSTVDTSAVVDSYSYSPGISFFTRFSETQYDSGRVKLHNLTTLHVNAAGYADSAYFNSSDGQALLDITTYDSLNYPVTLTEYYDTVPLPATRTETHKTYLYYQPYLTSAVVQTSTVNNISVFPNPASSIINIKWQGFMMNERTAITVTNSSVQTMLKEIISWQKEIEQLSVASLPTGTYWISVSNAKGLLTTVQVVKQ